MLDTVSREIARAARAGERRRRATERLPVLVAALDDLLFELEELNLRRIAVVPAACRVRAAELIAEATRRAAAPGVPEAVADLMERVYEAQDLALVRRRRAGWGLTES